MSCLVQVDKQEWDAFQVKLSELEKYRAVLRELETTHCRPRALDNSGNNKRNANPECVSVIGRVA